MTDFERLHSKQTKIFILVCTNFVLFLVLFSGLGYVTWQSAALVHQLQKDLDRAEQTIGNLRDRIQQVDIEVITDRLVTTASKQIGESIRGVVQAPDIMDPIVQATEKLAATQEMIMETGEAIQGIHEKVKGLDNEEIAQLVAYHTLKGLGDGFQKAAESRKPESVRTE